MKSSWIVNNACIIGSEHQFEKTNKQDFSKVVQTEEIVVGIICDGCSSGKYSEVGSTLIGHYLLQYLMKDCPYIDQDGDIQSIELFVQESVTKFIDELLDIMHLKGESRVDFIENCFLSTILFCVLRDNCVYIGHCGDGIYVINRGDKSEVVNIDQDNRPHYIAYNNIPQNFLFNIDILKGIHVQQYDLDHIDSIIIGSDGIEPLLLKNMTNELLNTNGRQLQRKFNVWQTKEKLFSDDASCIVFEKHLEKIDESNI